jgi:DNA cross-link repair 1A protein
MHEPTVLESRGGVPITVTLISANHCPGAVMMLFQVKHKTILHVGDFRWNYAIMSAQAPLRPFCRPPWSNAICARTLDELFLDTTYCNPKYDLPTQAECIQGAVDKAVKEVEEARLQKQRLLMLFGSYTIGKEAVRFGFECPNKTMHHSSGTDRCCRIIF